MPRLLTLLLVMGAGGICGRGGGGASLVVLTLQPSALHAGHGGPRAVARSLQRHVHIHSYLVDISF